MGEGDLRSAVDALRARVDGLESRLARLEAGRQPASPDGATVADAESSGALALPAGAVALAGRTLLVLAGAYLVRALTDAGVLPALPGALLGLGYAGFWLLPADRDARAGRRASAVLHGLAASAVAFPLIWETTVRFGLLGGGSAGALVWAFALLGLTVAWRHRLSASAWLTTVAATLTVLAVLVSTHAPVAALWTLLALGAVVEWLAFRDAWLGLRWCVGVALDAVAVLVVVVARPEPPAAYAGLVGSEAVAALLALPALHFASVAARTLRRGCPVSAFEVVQGTLAASLGFVGAHRVMSAHGDASDVPALFAATLGLLCYAVAFAHAERRPGQGRNFYFYSTAGGLLVLGGTLALDSGSAMPLLWSGLGLAAVGLGRRFDRTTLRTHGALYLLAGGLAAGLGSAGARALAGMPPSELPRLAWAVALAAGIAWALLAGEREAEGWARARWPRLLLAVLVVLTLAHAALCALDATLGSRLAAHGGAHVVAHSAVLVALVLGLAWLSQRGQPELVWLVYPLLALGGLRLVLQDVRAGRPGPLVVSLGLYGGLLVLLPRLLKPRVRPDAC